MTSAAPPPRNHDIAWQAEAPVVTPPLTVPREALVAEQLLDGGEVILLALKPSLWFIPLVSLKWLAVAVTLAVIASLDGLWGWRSVLLSCALYVALIRLGWATLQWTGRYYVLTDRRVMRIRGVFNVEVFECPLTRIQNTCLTLSLPERLVRTGTIQMSTAGATGGQASWRVVSRPLIVHEQLRAAIDRARHRHAL